MGLAGLTAVFGMGTGGTPPVWSPEKPPAGDQARRQSIGWSVTPAVLVGADSWPTGGSRRDEWPPGMGMRRRLWIDAIGDDAPPGIRSSAVPLVGTGGRIGVVKRSAVRTGRLRRSPAVHSQPIDLVVFQEPSHVRAGNLVLKRASRLDAFSAYPFPTWLPGGAPSGTAGTPEVGPPQSSRTRGDPSQVSSAHGR